jgi:hypothetical protein
MSIHFEEILYPIQGNFEEQNKVLETYIIINYCIIIINYLLTYSIEQCP